MTVLLSHSLIHSNDSFKNADSFTDESLNHSFSTFIQKEAFSVCSKRDISLYEGNFGVKTIMAAILKGRSKPKCSKLVTSKGPSELRISKGTTDGHFGLT